jgi:hypothetical protein
VPIAALPQVGEEPGAILMKMQKCLATDIKYPRSPLDETVSRPKSLQHVGQRVERGRPGMFHPLHSYPIDLARLCR